MNENNMKKIINEDSIMIIGIILMLIVIISMGSFAFVSWRSKDNGKLITQIGDVAIVKFENGLKLSSDRLNPVLDYKDGIKTSFNITRTIDSPIYIKLYFIINKLTEEIKNDNLKYKLFIKNNKNDYIQLSEGSFDKIKENNLILLENYKINQDITYFDLYVYIDGNKNNDNIKDISIDLTLGVEANSQLNNITTNITSGVNGESEDITNDETRNIEEE